LILNVAVGGNWPGYPDATTPFPGQMLVDYVRVYQPAAPYQTGRALGVTDDDRNNFKGTMSRSAQRFITGWLVCAVLLVACQAQPTPQPTLAPTEAATPMPTADAFLYRDPAQPLAARVDDLLARMTLAEKIGQMTQVEKNSIEPEDIAEYAIGSILSGGGGSPIENTAAGWAAMTDGFQQYALQTRLAIPLIYGVDAVHGHGNLHGATIFPHNIGLGATRDADLVERIGRATAAELAATGIWWNFAPVVAAPQDIRWGRTYEGYSENTALVSELGAAYLRGLQGADLSDPLAVLATAKHFVGDGGTQFGTSTTNIFQPYLLDQGDMLVDEATLRANFLPPYQAAIQAGAQSIMVSFSSWNGVKMHAQKYLLSDVLKGELGFAGFLVSDWQGIDQIPGDYPSDVVTSINAGLDMVMVPYDYKTFIAALTQAVDKGDVPMSRIDDAVRRILTVKFQLGLFEQPYSDPATLALVGSDEHRALAREAVRKSLVLLKNDAHTLPLSKETPLIFVAGQAADDIGLQSGGWTIEWQGKTGNITPGTTIVDGLKQTVSASARVEFNRFGKFDNFVDAQGNPEIADVGIVVLAEQPYAEGVGDRADLRLAESDSALIDRVRERSQRLVVVLLSGRPLIITEQLPGADAFVAAWLPGTEGQGVADVLFGDFEFTGKLPYTWPRWNEQLPFDFASLPSEGCDAPLFPFGYGLTIADPSPTMPDCPTP
jgi:beta-glucosidase